MCIRDRAVAAPAQVAGQEQAQPAIGGCDEGRVGMALLQDFGEGGEAKEGGYTDGRQQSQDVAGIYQVKAAADTGADQKDSGERVTAEKIVFFD